MLEAPYWALAGASMAKGGHPGDAACDHLGWAPPGTEPRDKDHPVAGHRSSDHENQGEEEDHCHPHCRVCHMKVAHCHASPPPEVA